MASFQSLTGALLGAPAERKRRVDPPEASRAIPRPLLLGVLCYLAIYGTWLAFR